MKSTGYFDIDGKELLVGTKCKDIIENVDDIEIVEEDGEFYALPEGLDPEPLSRVASDLKICV